MAHDVLLFEVRTPLSVSMRPGLLLRLTCASNGLKVLERDIWMRKQQWPARRHLPS